MLQKPSSKSKEQEYRGYGPRQVLDKSRICLKIHPETSINTTVHMMSFVHDLKENSRLNLFSQHLASVVL